MKLWLLHLVLILPIATLANAGSIGKITELVNTPPSIQRQNSTLTGNKGIGVEMNDSIKTSRGKTGITFEDDTRVQVNENSKLVIDDFVYDPKSKTGKLGAKIALGTVRYASGQIAKNSPQSVALNTPSATISVRGTDFTATVDELGQSTIILLPSCPDNKPTRTKDDIEKNCKVGSIIVESDAGQVVLTQAFQATRVESRSAIPAKPVILNFSEDTIGNMILLSPPQQLGKEERDSKLAQKNFLDVDFLKEQGLANALDSAQAQIFQDTLDYDFLDSSFLGNFFDMIGEILNEKLLREMRERDSVLPDYKKSSGIIAVKDEINVSLCRNDGSNMQCVSTPLAQNSVIYQTQGNLEFKNRVNSGIGTTITLIQK
jgi:hypothetical protein